MGTAASNAQISYLEDEYFHGGLSEISSNVDELELYTKIEDPFKHLSDTIIVIGSQSPQFDEMEDKSTFENVPYAQDPSLKKQLIELDSKVVQLESAVSLAILCSDYVLQIMENSHQSGYFKKQLIKGTESKMKAFQHAVQDILIQKPEAEDFPFDFWGYTACILCAAKFLAFLYDMDTIIDQKDHLINDFMHFKRHFYGLPEDIRVNLQSSIDSVNMISEFLSRDLPFISYFSRRIYYHARSHILQNCLGRFLLIHAYSLTNNTFLSELERIMLFKAMGSGLLVAEIGTPQGAFREPNLHNLPFLFCIQTLNSAANAHNDKGKEREENNAFDILVTLQKKSIINEQTHPMVLGVFSSVQYA